MESPLPISVIVVNYNAGEALGTLVQGLQGQVKQIIVVDNASTDHSFDRISVGEGLVKLQNAHNAGFAAAVNQALKQVTQPWTLLLNPDCKLDSGILQRLLQRMEQGEDKVAGVRIVNADGSEQRASRRNLPTLVRLLREVLGLPGGVNLNKEAAEGQITVEAVSGAFVLIQTELFRQMGGLDEGYFLHCEDLDLFARLKALGHRVIWDGDLRVEHGKGSANCSKLVVEQHKHAGMLRYFDRHMKADWPLGLRTAAMLFIRLHGWWTALKIRMGWKGVRR